MIHVRKKVLQVCKDMRVIFFTIYSFCSYTSAIFQHSFALKILYCSTFIVGSFMKMFSHLLVALYESICKMIKCKCLSMYTWIYLCVQVYTSCQANSSHLPSVGMGFHFRLLLIFTRFFDNQWDGECRAYFVCVCNVKTVQKHGLELLHSVSVGQPKRLILMGQDQCETLNGGGSLIKPHCFSSGWRVA